MDCGSFMIAVYPWVVASSPVLHRLRLRPSKILSLREGSLINLKRYAQSVERRSPRTGAGEWCTTHNECVCEGLR